MTHTHTYTNVVIHCAFEAPFVVWQKRRNKIGRSRKFHDGRIHSWNKSVGNWSGRNRENWGAKTGLKRVLQRWDKDPVIPGKIDCARANTYRGEKRSELCHILRLISLGPFSRLRDVKFRTDYLAHSRSFNIARYNLLFAFTRVKSRK